MKPRRKKKKKTYKSKQIEDLLSIRKPPTKAGQTFKDKTRYNRKDKKWLDE